MTPPTQTLQCANGGHPWTRSARRGPKPASCPEHPRPVDPTLAALTPEEAATLASITPADVDLLFAEEVAAYAARLSAAAERNRLWHTARVARLGLVPEDRSPQRQRAEAVQARKEANAAGWLNREGTAFAAVYTDPATHTGPAKGSHRPTARAEFAPMSYEGTRLGQDAASREISHGSNHTTLRHRGPHPKGEVLPEECGECYLIAEAARAPGHLRHRAS